MDRKFKKFYFVFYLQLVVGCVMLSAQNVNDVFTFSQSSLNGSARFVAMGGSFQALGGDPSGVLSNPAGSAIYLNGEFNATLFYDNKNTKSIYGNTVTTMTGSESDVFSLGQASVIFPVEFMTYRQNNSSSKFSVGMFYSGRNYYKNDFVVNGENTLGIDSYFVNHANGSRIKLDELQFRRGENISNRYDDLGEDFGYSAQQALLGFHSYLIEPIDDNLSSTEYISALSEYQQLPLEQNFIYNQSGINHQMTLNFAFELQNRYYFGTNINIDWFRYKEISDYLETGHDVHSPYSEINFVNNFSTLGIGYSFQLGALVKLSEFFRMGMTYETPKWIDFEDETSQLIINETLVDEKPLEPIDPNIINVYSPHTLRIAAKYSVGAAFVFGQRGLISIDYSIQPLQNSKFSDPEFPNSDVFSGTNNLISSYFQTHSILRVGGEINLNRFSFRCGYFNESSPFANFNQQTRGFTAGFGYKFGPHQINAAMIVESRTTNHQFYTNYYDSQGTPFSYQLEKTPFGLFLSYHFKFL